MFLSINDSEGARKEKVDHCARVTLEDKEGAKIGTIVIGDILRKAIPIKKLTKKGSAVRSMLGLKAGASSVGVLGPRGALLATMTENPFYIIPNEDGGLDIYG